MKRQVVRQQHDLGRNISGAPRLIRYQLGTFVATNACLFLAINPSQALPSTIYSNSITQPHDKGEPWCYLNVLNFGEANAQCNLGWLHHQGIVVRKDIKAAAELYAKAGASGVVSADYNLGLLYQHGEGVPLDYETSAQLYQKTHDADTCSSENDLGFMGEMGEIATKVREPEATHIKKVSTHGRST